MRRVTAILSSIFFFCILVQAQQGSAKNWDNILDRYESLCDQCLKLKFRAESGEKISARSFSKLVSSLNALKEELRDGDGQMSSLQRRRFEAIRNRYENGSSLPRQQVSNIQKTVEKTVEIVFDTIRLRPALNPVPALASNFTSPNGISSPRSCAFSVPSRTYTPPRKQRKLSIPVHASFSYFPEISGGLMLGFLMNSYGYGAYLRIHSNFTPLSTSYDCLSNGSYEGGTVWTSGWQKRQILRIGAGVQLGISKNGLRFYAGAGYGSVTTAWEDASKSDWIRVSDLSPKGLALEAGAIYPLRRLELAAGISTIAFRQLGLDFSLGFRF